MKVDRLDMYFVAVAFATLTYNVQIQTDLQCASNMSTFVVLSTLLRLFHATAQETERANCPRMRLLSHSRTRHRGVKRLCSFCCCCCAHADDDQVPCRAHPRCVCELLQLCSLLSLTHARSLPRGPRRRVWLRPHAPCVGLLPSVLARAAARRAQSEPRHRRHWHSIVGPRPRVRDLLPTRRRHSRLW